MPDTTASAHLEITAADGTTQIPVMLVSVTDDQGNAVPHIQERLTAASADSPLGDWLEARVQEDFRRGVGLDYNIAPGVCTRIPEYAIAAGAATSVTLPAHVLTGASATPLVAIEEYGADLFVGQEGDDTKGGRVMIATGGVAPLTNSLNLSAGRRLRDLVVMGGYLYAVSDNGSLGAGELHRWNGTAWSLGSSDASFSGALFTSARYRSAKVTWNTTGTPALRMVSIDNSRTIAYTKPSANPMLQASWIEGVETGTGFSLTDLAAARKHVWLGAKDGLFDMDEQGNSPNLVGYEVHALSANMPLPVHYLNGYVYMSLGYQLDRVYVGVNGALQENAGYCAPGLDTAAEHEYRGLITAMFSDQGWLGAAVYNPITTKSGIFWGKDRTLLGIESPNPLIWHGPEVHSIAGYRVTKTKPSGLAGDLRLWICSLGPASVATLDWVSLPSIGTPLGDLISNGLHRFTTGAVVAGSPWNRTSQLHSLADTGDDKAAYKTVYQDTYGTRGLPATGVTPAASDPYLEVYTRADPTPGSTSWGIASRVSNGPTQAITPAVVTGGFKLEWRVDFFNPNGTATPPLPGLLDAVRVQQWRSVTTFRVLRVTVEYGDAVPNLRNGQDETFSPERTTELLKEVMAVGRTTLRLPDDSRWTIKFRQVLDGDSIVETVGPYGKTVRATMQLALLAAL